jgi:hypothetical protein
MQKLRGSSPALFASPVLDIGRRNGVNFCPSLVCLPQDPSITSRPDAVSVGLRAMKQPLAVVTRTSRRLLFFKFQSRTAPDAVIPSHIDPFNGPFEVADAANARACDVRCPRAAHDLPEPSSIALEAPVCLVAPVEARYTAVDAAPHSPVVGEFFQREAPGH